MKTATLIIVFSLHITVLAQNKTEDIKTTIHTFFEGFHKQDSTLIKTTVSENMILQTVARDSLGHTVLKTVSVTDFIKLITTLPKDTKFNERLLDMNILVDDNLAHVWTPYEFTVNDRFSHCGVNSFQLINSNGAWKIIYIIDTRRKICDFSN